MWTLNKPDDAWKLGCGRYLQERGALLRLDSEIARLGKNPMFLTGEKSFAAVLSLYPELQSLRERAFTICAAPCNLSQAQILCERARADGCDVIVGMGGGRIMDIAKLVANMAKTRMLMAPTLSATCAAYAPLSVVYSMEGCTEGAVFFDREVDCILADMDVLARQPVRSACAGMLDAIAKLVEMHHYDEPSLACPAMRTAVTLAQHVFDRLTAIAGQAMADVKACRASEAVEEMVWLTLVGTGMVSGLASHWNHQSAIAHCLYDGVRMCFPEESRPYLHGEIVALGMYAQTYYTGWNMGEVLAVLDKLGMPRRLHDVGVPEDEAAFYALYSAVLQGMQKTNRPVEAGRLDVCMRRLQ